MAVPQPAKPIFKVPEQKPFKMAEPPSVPMSADPVTAPAVHDGKWKPIATAPQTADAIFLVRATVNGEGIKGTETLVRYRASRKMVGRKWQPALTIIDDRLGTKLGFRPTEWKESPEKAKVAKADA